MTETDAVLSWDQVRQRIDALPRGTGYKLAQALGMNSSYFYRKVKGGGELTARQSAIVAMFLGEQVGELMPETPAPPADRTRLPVFGFAAAGGEDIIALNDGQIVDWLQLPNGLELGPGEYFAVRAIGSSMEPRIFSGEHMIARRNYPPGRGKDVIVEFKDGTGVVKTYSTQKDGHVFVDQYNPPKQLGFEQTTVKALHAVAFKI